MNNSKVNVLSIQLLYTAYIIQSSLGHWRESCIKAKAYRIFCKPQFQVTFSAGWTVSESVPNINLSAFSPTSPLWRINGLISQRPCWQQGQCRPPNARPESKPADLCLCLEDKRPRTPLLFKVCVYVCINPLPDASEIYCRHKGF